MEINLKYERVFFEEIFYCDYRGSYFKSDLTKRSFENTMISLVLLFLVVYYMLSENKFSMFVLILAPAFLISVSRYIYYALELRKRRYNISKYLDKLELVNTHKLLLNKESFIVQFDQNLSKELWSDIKFKEISKICIYLSSEKENYMFPKKSFSDIEWNEFVKVINDRVNV